MTSESVIATGNIDYPMVDAANQVLQRLGINRIFLAAYLITGSAAQAEHAMLEAIDSWSADRSESDLLEQTIRAALQPKDEQAQPAGNRADPECGRLAGELQAVVRLSPQLRHCFVLRVLVGMSRQACSQLLDLTRQGVDQHTCAAMRSLPLKLPLVPS
jgi:hypothetical protein